VRNGTYEISSTPSSSTIIMGTTEWITSAMGLLNRYEERNRFTPTGRSDEPQLHVGEKNNGKVKLVDTAKVIMMKL